MSTYTGDAQIVAVVDVTESGTATHYTVGAGKFARVYVKGLTLAGGENASIGGRFKTGAFSGDIGDLGNNGIVLAAGDTIATSGGGAVIAATVLEFNTP